MKVGYQMIKMYKQYCIFLYLKAQNIMLLLKLFEQHYLIRSKGINPAFLDSKFLIYYIVQGYVNLQDSYIK